MSDEGQVCEQGSANPRRRKSVSWKRDPLILARLPRVERLHLAGRTNVTIAAALDISEATVRDDLKRIQELWRERAGASIDDQRAKILAELEDARTRAIAAAEFDEQCERAVLFDESPIGETDDQEDTSEVVTFRGRRISPVHRDAKGSAQFRGQKAQSLNVARAASMDKAKLLGLVVDKVAPTNGAGEDLSIDELMERFSRSMAQPADSADAGQP